MSTMDWSNDIAVCNAFVEAVHADNYALAGDACAALASERLVGTFSVIEGVVLTEENIPTHPDNVPYDVGEVFGGESGIELLEGRVLPERLAVLMEGDDVMSLDELFLWRTAVAEKCFTDWADLDWDTYTMWAVRIVRHADGREAYLADVGGGYSFSGSTNYCLGYTQTFDQALALLKTQGYIDIEDFRERSRAIPPEHAVPSPPNRRDALPAPVGPRRVTRGKKTARATRQSDST